ncbi:cytochrome P450 [Pseudomonas sp. 6D_7.1_Bac1]|uniref:cytochrome P450 n=1 Tax=Pseudomonas sp. 6D_7.1_Bac1 TaxID=2971615 RepID=UPI0021C9000E|nr:cytochrome P450 [Pseudomonas sp. 6D_7.1_Bac1]MCU1750245.1 cytochrome P450 [Pseudomonas sp. 6D_7.1_Bac1]
MDPIIAATHLDPYPYYASLRADGGLSFHQGSGLWVASSARAVAAILAHPDCKVRPAHEPVPKAIAQGAAGKVFGQLMRMNEGERQRCPRSAIQPGLELIDAEAVSALVRARLISPSADGLRKAMFMGPVCVVAALLGFSPTEGRATSELTADFVACLSPLSNQAQLDAAHVAAERLGGYFVERLSAGDNQSPLLEGIRQRLADHDTLLANLIGLFSQTYEATAGLIGNALLALIRNPQLKGEMQRDPARVSDLLAEVQRHDPSVQNTRRFVSAPCEIGGASLKPGDAILVLLASANRDPQLNDNPDTLILDRPTRRSFTFGADRHQCPGQALALNIASATLGEILTRNIALDQLAWEYRPSLNGRIPLFTELSEAQP